VIVSELTTVAVSYAELPVVSVPAHGAFDEASNTIVAVLEFPAPTANGSQLEVEPE
jgi:hypothetical protein